MFYLRPPEGTLTDRDPFSALAQDDVVACGKNSTMSCYFPVEKQRPSMGAIARIWGGGKAARPAPYTARAVGETGETPPGAVAEP